MLAFVIACVAPYIQCDHDLVAFARTARAHVAIVRTAVRDRIIVGSHALAIATHVRAASFTDFVVVAARRTAWLQSVRFKYEWLWTYAATTRERAIWQLRGVKLTVPADRTLHTRVYLSFYNGTGLYAGFVADSRSEANRLAKFLQVVPQRAIISAMCAHQIIERLVSDPRCDVIVDMRMICYRGWQAQEVRRNYRTIERAVRAQVPGAQLTVGLDREHRWWWLQRWAGYAVETTGNRSVIRGSGVIIVEWDIYTDFSTIDVVNQLRNLSLSETDVG